jgi:lipopolysaccharide export system permease protein
MASIILFIRISKITSVIKLDFFELGKLYIYMLPNILMYTLPVTFFIGIVISLFKMSKENEMTVLFSLGYSPRKIAKFYFRFSFLITIALLLNSIFLIPISKQLYKSFVNYKQTEAILNIKATEFGQSFSNWLIFTDESTGENSYKNIVLFNYDEKKAQENFIIAKRADLKSEKGVLKLNLYDGRTFEIKKESINQIDYKIMKINTTPRFSIFKTDSVFDYWKIAYTDKKRAYDLAFHIIISLFPLATYLFAMTIGIVNPRYEKGHIYIYIFLVIILYYALTYSLSSLHPPSSIVIVYLVSVFASKLFFKQKILARY